MLLNCGVGEDSWESLGLQRNQTSQSYRKSVPNIHWKDCCWSWSFNTLATWWEEPTHWKRPWCWERLKAGGEGDDKEWDGWMASPTWWTWVWASSRRWWRTEKPGVLLAVHGVAKSWTRLSNWTKTRPHTVWVMTARHCWHGAKQHRLYVSHWLRPRANKTFFTDNKMLISSHFSHVTKFSSLGSFAVT